MVLITEWTTKISNGSEACYSVTCSTTTTWFWNNFPTATLSCWYSLTVMRTAAPLLLSGQYLSRNHRHCNWTWLPSSSLNFSVHRLCTRCQLALRCRRDFDSAKTITNSLTWILWKRLGLKIDSSVTSYTAKLKCAHWTLLGSGNNLLLKHYFKF